MFLQKFYDSSKKIITASPYIVFIRISAAYFLRKANQRTSIIITSAFEQNLSDRYFVSKMCITAPSSLEPSHACIEQIKKFICKRCIVYPVKSEQKHDRQTSVIDRWTEIEIWLFSVSLLYVTITLL